MSAYVFLSIATYLCLFFFTDPTPTEIYTLSLHDALPILLPRDPKRALCERAVEEAREDRQHVCDHDRSRAKSEEHTSELQSHSDLVCRLLLEKKKKTRTSSTT